MNILKHINDNGYYVCGHIDSLPSAKSLIEQLFGEHYIIKENVISIDSNSPLPSDSLSDIPWHQEDYYKGIRANYLCLYCSSSGLPQETTRLIPTEGIIRSLANRYPDIEQYKISFTRVRGIEQSSWFPLIEVIHGHLTLRFAEPDSRFRFVKCNPDNEIIESISKMIGITKVIDIEPVEGNLVIFDNYRFLHSRPTLSANTNRRLQRFLVYSQK